MDIRPLPPPIDIPPDAVALLRTREDLTDRGFFYYYEPHAEPLSVRIGYLLLLLEQRGVKV